MDISDEEYKRIQEYLDGKMSKDEEKIFLLEIGGNDFLKDCLEVEIHLRSGVLFEDSSFTGRIKDDSENDFLRNIVSNAGRDWMERNKKIERIKSVKKYLSIAASIALIVTIGLVFIHRQNNKISSLVSGKNEKSHQDQINQEKNPQHYSVPETSRLKQTPNDSGFAHVNTLNNIALIYQKNYHRDTLDYSEDYGNSQGSLIASLDKDYKSDGATNLLKYNFEDLPISKGAENANLTKSYFHYFKGLEGIKANRFILASKELNWVADSSGSERIKENAEWYLAMISFKMKNLKEGTYLLNKIIKNPKADFYTPAQKILQSLKK